VGVVDINGDRLLDVFTSNEDARQSLLLGDGHGGFTDVLSDRGLDQDPDFPGLEDSDTAPAFDRSGLYVYYQNRTLILRNHGGEDPLSVTGLLKLSGKVTVEQRGGFEVAPPTRASQVSTRAS
jgi:hypothetical protein